MTTDDNHTHTKYRIDLVALPFDSPPSIRLRHFLKQALRAWGLKAVRVEELCGNMPPDVTVLEDLAD